MKHKSLLPRMIGLTLVLLLLVACSAPQTTPTSDVLILGQIKGVLVDKDTGQPILAKPGLFRDRLENETEAELAEIQEYLDKVEIETDSQGVFLFTGVPPGQYGIFTKQHGIVSSIFTVSPGQFVDLGEIEVPK